MDNKDPRSPGTEDTFSFSRSFVRGEATIGFWNFAKKGVGVIGVYLILDALSLYQYGVYQLLLAGYAIIAEFSFTVFSSSVTNDIARHIAEGDEPRAKRLYLEYAAFRALMGAIPLSLVFILAPYISPAYGPDAVLWIRILSLLFAVEAVESVAHSLLKLRLDFSAVSVRSTFQKIFQTLLLVLFAAFYHISLTEVLIAQVVAPAVALLFMAGPLRRAWRAWAGIRAYSEPLMPGIIRSYGKWEIPQALVRNAYARLRPWVVKLFLGTEAVGVFGVAQTAMTMVRNFIPRQTLALLVPRKVHDREYMRRLAVYGTKYYALIGVVLGAFGAAAYPFAVYLLFPKFSPTIPLFLLLSLSVPVFAYGKLISALLVAERRQKAEFAISFGQNLIGIFALVFFLPVFGILGLAVAEIASLSLGAAAAYSYIVRIGVMRPVGISEIIRFDEEDRRIMRVLMSHVRRGGSSQ